MTLGGEEFQRLVAQQPVTGGPTTYYEIGRPIPPVDTALQRKMQEIQADFPYTPGPLHQGALEFVTQILRAGIDSTNRATLKSALNTYLAPDIEILRTTLSTTPCNVFLDGPKQGGKGVATSQFLKLFGGTQPNVAILAMGDSVRLARPDIGGNITTEFRTYIENSKPDDAQEAVTEIQALTQDKTLSAKSMAHIIRFALIQQGFSLDDSSNLPTIIWDGVLRTPDSEKMIQEVFEELGIQNRPTAYIQIEAPVGLLEARQSDRNWCPDCSTTHGATMFPPPIQHIHVQEEVSCAWINQEKSGNALTEVRLGRVREFCPNHPITEMETKPGDDKPYAVGATRLRNDLEMQKSVRANHPDKLVRVPNAIKIENPEGFPQGLLTQQLQEVVYTEDGALLPPQLSDQNFRRGPFMIREDDQTYYAIEPWLKLVQVVAGLKEVLGRQVNPEP